jgi:hypothetical protein
VRGIKNIQNPLQNTFNIPQYFMIPESQNTVTFPFQKFGPHLVSLILFSMLAAVKFDDQISFHTTEVGNETPNRMLSSELGAI